MDDVGPAQARTRWPASHSEAALRLQGLLRRRHRGRCARGQRGQGAVHRHRRAFQPAPTSTWSSCFRRKALRDRGRHQLPGRGLRGHEERHHRAQHQGDADRRHAAHRRPRPLRDLHRHPLLRPHAGAVHQARRLRPEARRPMAIWTWTSTTPWKTSGIVLGQLFAKALGDRKGINRAGYFVLPMDETLAVVAVDLGGRPALVYKDLVKVRLVGDLQTELVEDFFGGFVNHAGANLHAKVLYGRSNHHKIEAIFKCFARAMKYACSQRRAPEGPTCPPPRGCYDRHLRLRRRQPAIGPEHAGRDRLRNTRWCATPPGCAPATKIMLPGRGPLRPDDARARCSRRARNAA